jgi:hypothetical protein
MSDEEATRPLHEIRDLLLRSEGRSALNVDAQLNSDFDRRRSSVQPSTAWRFKLYAFAVIVAVGATFVVCMALLWKL